MELQILQIGNSKGLLLGKTLIEKYNFTDKVEILLEKDYLILKPISQPRRGWGDLFKQMNENGDDQLLLDDVLEDKNQYFEKPLLIKKL